MRLRRLEVTRFKNLHDCVIEFPAVRAEGGRDREDNRFLQAVIGGNGSGKSNLIEAILHILVSGYFGKPAPFAGSLEFLIRNRTIRLESRGRRLEVSVDGEPWARDRFSRRLQDWPGQVHYPELTLVYYSGDCNRVSRLLSRYRRAFEKLTRQEETANHQPLFVQTSSEQARVILLGLFAHNHSDLLERVGVRRLTNVAITLQSPTWFNPDQHEPKTWGTSGAMARILSAFNDMAELPESVREPRRRSKEQENSEQFRERRTYRFNRADGSPGVQIQALASRLTNSSDNLYTALEHLRHRGLVHAVEYEVIGSVGNELFEFDQLSEGEKQLLAVIGALRLTTQSENLVLLDEPDTHLNPAWSWEYMELLRTSLRGTEADRSHVVMATHDPVMISGLTRDEVLVAHPPGDGVQSFRRPRRDPRGQGVANLLSSSEFFGLPSSLDKETQKLMDERLEISARPTLTDGERNRLRELNRLLQILQPGISERDPEYVEFLRSRRPRED